MAAEMHCLPWWRCGLVSLKGKLVLQIQMLTQVLRHASYLLACLLVKTLAIMQVTTPPCAARRISRTNAHVTIYVHLAKQILATELALNMPNKPHYAAKCDSSLLYANCLPSLLDLQSARSAGCVAVVLHAASTKQAIAHGTDASQDCSAACIRGVRTYAHDVRCNPGTLHATCKFPAL